MSVEPPTEQVNARRAYNSNRRRRSARHPQRLLDAALARFLEQGYSATTIDSIAADAAVSAATIYKTYGSKAGLVRALCERALGGRGPVPAEQRSDALQANEPDPRKIIEGWGRLTAEGRTAYRPDPAPAPRCRRRRPHRRIATRGTGQRTTHPDDAQCRLARPRRTHAPRNPYVRGKRRAVDLQLA